MCACAGILSLIQMRVYLLILIFVVFNNTSNRNNKHKQGDVYYVWAFPIKKFAKSLFTTVDLNS